MLHFHVFLVLMFPISSILKNLTADGKSFLIRYNLCPDRIPARIIGLPPPVFGTTGTALVGRPPAIVQSSATFWAGIISASARPSGTFEKELTAPVIAP